MAREVMAAIGADVTLARMNLGLSRRAAARLAGVSAATQRRVEEGRPSVAVEVACRVAAAVGLKVWAKAFPVRTPSLRDTGQLELAERLNAMAHPSLRVTMELGLGNGRSIDLVGFGPTEITAIEIYRRMADYQAQFRSADAKRIELATSHQRPVRLVLAIEDTRHNRRAMAEHARAVAHSLPAAPRAVFASWRSGRPLGSDGLVWVRRPRSDRTGPTTTLASDHLGQ